MINFNSRLGFNPILFLSSDLFLPLVNLRSM